MLNVVRSVESYWGICCVCVMRGVWLSRSIIWNVNRVIWFSWLNVDTLVTFWSAAGPRRPLCVPCLCVLRGGILYRFHNVFLPKYESRCFSWVSRDINWLEIIAKFWIIYWYPTFCPLQGETNSLPVDGVPPQCWVSVPPLLWNALIHLMPRYHDYIRTNFTTALAFPVLF